MRTLVVAVAVLGLASVAGGQALEAAAADRLAARLAASAGEVEGVDVELVGFPVALRAATGRVPTVVLRAERLTTRAPRVSFAPVHLELSDVRFDPVMLARGRDRTITVGDGEATATLPSSELTRLLREEGLDVEVGVGEGRLTATGTVHGRPVRIVADVAVTAGELRLTAREVAVDGQVPPAAVASAFDRRLALPVLPGGVRLTDAAVVDAGVALRATIRGVLDLELDAAA